MEEQTRQTEPEPPGWLPPPMPGPRLRHGWRDRHAWRNRHGCQEGPELLRNLRRDPENSLLGGVAAGIAVARGHRDRVTAVRVVFAVAAVITWSYAIPLYFLAWLLIPAAGADASIASKARHDSRGWALAFGLASLLMVLLVLGELVNDGDSGLVESWGWPQVVSVGCLALIWRNASPDEQAALRRLVEPLGGIGERARRATVLRLSLAVAALLGGLGWLLSAHESLALLRPLGGLVLVTAGIVLLLGPWWFRIARDLVLERQARARAEERSDMAARVHDSVLQTLALIQRRSDDPQAVVQLARAQERELRSWLFEGRAPGTADSDSFADGIRQIQRDVEARHGVPVEVVNVGDCPLEDGLSAMLAAAREAVVNAAKWSGASVISVFAEVSPEKTEVVVRDRGKGFDPDTVPDDRKGLAESVHARMSRHGGSVSVQSAPGEGTKVSLSMPRSPAGGLARTGRRQS